MSPARAVAHGPLTRIVAAIQARRRSASEVTQMALAHLDQLGASLNVLAASDAERAVARAAAMAPGALLPLAGAPTLVKDLEDWAGMPTRQGSRTLADAAPAPTTSPTPARLAAAGAIVVGKSTLPEFAIEGYCANDLTGVTRNPWNPALSPGGSSGGSAAALAAGLVAIATATDGGGSVRIPAALCGLVGLKPTTGLIGRSPEPDWIDYSTDGVMAASVDDLALILSVVRGPVAGDPAALPASLHGSLARWRGAPARLLAAEGTRPWGPLPGDVVRALRAAVDLVASVLARPVAWMAPEEFFASGDPDLDWYTTCATEHVHRRGADAVARDWDLYHVATREFFTRGLEVDAAEYLAARRRRFAYARRLDELLGEDGLLLTPVVTAVGWPADGRDESGEVHGLHPRHLSTVIQNITGLPALSVPMGTLDSGLPFGLQITAPRYHDDRLVDLALLLQRAAPWPLAAPGYVTLADALDLP